MRERIAAAATVLLAAALAAGQGGSVDLQRALDRPVDLTVEDAPIAEVFQQLSAKTGVKFLIDEHTIEALPYGDQTRVAVRLKNVTLRKDLSRMLAPQALSWSIRDNAVLIVPTEALARTCRRASYDELRVLGVIHTERLQGAEQAGLIEQLRAATGQGDLQLTFRVEGDTKAAQADADRALPGTAAEWLDRLCGAGRGWTWYLAGREIVILAAKAQTERQLLHRVSLRYQNEDLVTILLDLARKARLTVEMDPGVMNYVPSEKRTNFTLVMADATVRQALEVISGATGLVFLRTDQGLKVAPSEKLVETGMQGERRRTPFFVRMTLPGTDGAHIEVYIRAEELPPEIVERIEAEKLRLIERMRTGAGGASTTRPALP